MQVQVKPLAGGIGAELTGISLSDDFDVTELRELVCRHKVVFVRGQHLTAQAQQALAGRFGPVTSAHPVAVADQSQKTWTRRASDGYISDHWHTDVTFLPAPVVFTFLLAVEVPPCGGDTMWANTAAAYEALHPLLRELVGKLRVIHENSPIYGHAQRQTHSNDAKALAAYMNEPRKLFRTDHPLVHLHPETQERALVAGSFARHIVGMPSETSASILALIQSEITRPENCVRWTWRPGDVAIWDNRATQHYAIADYGDVERVMQRVTVEGQPLLGIDGTTSSPLPVSA